MGIDVRWEEWPDCRLLSDLRDEGSLVEQFLEDSRV
jgi:hypothetical protein